MDFFKLSRRFKEEEDGAVTVDWVVLTAAIVGLALLVIAAVRSASITLGNAISVAISEITVGG